jgi:hypothetical protein
MVPNSMRAVSSPIKAACMGHFERSSEAAERALSRSLMIQFATLFGLGEPLLAA